MKNIKDVCVIVQARLGSQRVPQKKIRPFADTTLTDIVVEKVKQCKSFPIKNFYLSVYEKELIDIANKHSVPFYERSEASANSEGTPMSEMYEWWNKLPYKYCVLVNGCTPFLKPETIDEFIYAYLKSESDGMFGVIEKKNYFWNENSEILTPLSEAVMNTKTVQKTFEAAHCLYAGRMDMIGEGVWMGDFNNPGEIELFPMSEQEVLDIDYEWQFKMCESLYETIYRL